MGPGAIAARLIRKKRKRGKKKKSPVSIYSSTWVGSIPYFFKINRVKLGLGTVMLFCVQMGVVEVLVIKRTFALRYTARRAKAGKEAIPKLGRKL